MDLKERCALATQGTAEVLIAEELQDLLSKKDHPSAYIGYEPSGPMTVGQLVTVKKVLDLERAGLSVTILLADMHAFINDKLGGSLGKIRDSGMAMQVVFRALGAGPAITFRWASDLVDSGEYVSRVLRVAKAMSLARVKRAMSIMGRKEEEAEMDAAKLIYPPMQVADIFELGVDVAYGGLDQRRAHVLAREVAQHYGWPVPIAIHTPLISSLKGGGRMNAGVGLEGTAEGGTLEKMSKSDPSSAIYVTDDEKTIRERIQKAYCPQGEVDGNPVVEIALHLLFPLQGKLTIDRIPKHGGPVAFDAPSDFLDKWRSKELHPMDLKEAVATAIAHLVEPVRKATANASSGLYLVKKRPIR